MILFVTLHGGCNFSRPQHATKYRSLAAASREWQRRLGATFYPCWGDAGMADLRNDGRMSAGLAWYVPDDYEHVTHDEYGRLVIDSTDMYPDRELTKGPRGGLRWEPC